jgi:outer membrane protein
MYKITKRAYVILLFILLIPVCINAQEVSLKDLISRALQNNQTVKSTVLEHSIASEKISEVKSNMLPQLNISGDYKYYTQVPRQLMDASSLGGLPNSYIVFGTGIPWSLGTTISLGQLIYSQEYITGVKLAHTGKELNELLIKKSKEEIAYNVSAAYYNAQILTSQMKFIESNIGNMEKLISTGELLYENQMIKQSDVDKLKLSKTMLETQQSTVKESYDEIINALKFLSGMPQSDNLVINNDISTEVITLPSLGIKPDRTELKLLEKKKELSELERKNIIAGFIPTLSACGVFNYSFYGKGGDYSIFKGYPSSWFGLQLSWNLFDGFAKKSKLQQKDLEMQKLNLQVNQLNENISMELKNSIQQISLQKTNIQSRREQLSLAEKIYDQTQLQFKEGLVNITDVIQSDNSLREAQNNYLVSTINLLNAQLSWKKATGKLINE